jgi:hypothetical protein
MICIDVLGSSEAVAHKATRRARQGKLARCWLVGIALVIVNLCFVKTNSVAVNKPMHYKQYAFIQLNHSFTEFYCLDELYHRESRWNPKARNGSHYGIPQGRSVYLSKVDGYKQVEWGIKYNLNRYGSMCKALQHFKIKGWH